MAFELDELREKLNAIDTTYYKNLDEKLLTVQNKEIVKQIIRDMLKRAEEYFQKGTAEDASYGLEYRKIAKALLDSI